MVKTQEKPCSLGRSICKLWTSPSSFFKTEFEDLRLQDILWVGLLLHWCTQGVLFVQESCETHKSLLSLTALAIDPFLALGETVLQSALLWPALVLLRPKDEQSLGDYQWIRAIKLFSCLHLLPQVWLLLPGIGSTCMLIHQGVIAWLGFPIVFKLKSAWKLVFIYLCFLFFGLLLTLALLFGLALAAVLFFYSLMEAKSSILVASSSF